MTHIKKLTIDRLSARHFKGVTEQMINIDGKDFTIYGDNGTGKTTTSDMWFWLTTDKDSLGRKDFGIKTKSKDGTTLSGLEHFAEATCTLPDGSKATFCKTFKEKWERERGAPKSEFTGHKTNHVWNQEPVSEGRYVERLKEICDPETMRLLTDPHYFSSDRPGKWGWKNRRELLLEICGDVSIADVIAAHPELAKLPEFLGSHTIDAKRKIIGSTQKQINEELESIPGKITEATLAKPTVEESEPIDIPALRNALSQHQNKRATLVSGGAIAEKNLRIAEIDAAIIAIESQLRTASTKGVDDLNTRIRAKANDAHDCVMKIERLERQIAESKKLVSEKEKRREALLQEWNAIKAEEFVFVDSVPDETFATECASCGQAIPGYQIDAWRQAAEDRKAERKQKALEEFNLDVAKRLEANREEGQNGTKYITEQKDKTTLAEREIETLRAAQQGYEAEKAALETERDGTTVVEVDLAADGRTKPLMLEKEQLTAEIQQLQEGNESEIRSLDEEIQTVSTRISFAEKQQTQQQNRDRQDARIRQLQERQSQLAKQYEALQAELYLIELFVVKKVDMLTDRINATFARTKFKLFDVQVNGGIDECCEATYEGVPYASLNHGSRINIGLDIINTLAEHYGFAPPIFIDNAESVTSIIPTHGQQIQLEVSAIDPVLDWEVTLPREERLVRDLLMRVLALPRKEATVEFNELRMKYSLADIKTMLRHEARVVA